MPRLILHQLAHKSVARPAFLETTTAAGAVSYLKCQPYVWNRPTALEELSAPHQGSPDIAQ